MQEIANNKDNIFLKFLYFLSLKSISDKIFLEGGASLSFIYGFKRVFSNDLDFTIEHQKFLPELISEIKEVAREFNVFDNFNVDLQGNKIIIMSKKGIVLSLDFYILSSKLFLYEEKYLTYNDQIFKIKTHSLEDMFAEKITNLFQKDRCEFKDILDINNIFYKLNGYFDSKTFTSYLKQKFSGKKIFNNNLSFFRNRMKEFEKSFLLYPCQQNLRFSDEFFSCEKILTKFL